MPDPIPSPHQEDKEISPHGSFAERIDELMTTQHRLQKKDKSDEYAGLLEKYQATEAIYSRIESLAVQKGQLNNLDLADTLEGILIYSKENNVPERGQYSHRFGHRDDLRKSSPSEYPHQTDEEGQFSRWLQALSKLWLYENKKEKIFDAITNSVIPYLKGEDITIEMVKDAEEKCFKAQDV